MLLQISGELLFRRCGRLPSESPNSQNHAEFRSTGVMLSLFHKCFHPIKTLSGDFQVQIVFKNGY